MKDSIQSDKEMVEQTKNCNFRCFAVNFNIIFKESFLWHVCEMIENIAAW